MSLKYDLSAVARGWEISQGVLQSLDQPLDVRCRPAQPERFGFRVSDFNSLRVRSSAELSTLVRIVWTTVRTRTSVHAAQTPCLSRGTHSFGFRISGFGFQV